MNHYCAATIGGHFLISWGLRGVPRLFSSSLTGDQVRYRIISEGDIRHGRRSHQPGGGRTMKHFRIILDWDNDEKVFITYVPALNNLSTYGDTREEALENTREAIIGYIEAAQKEGIPVTEDKVPIEWIDLEVAG
jgi:predicted RNase H-like HicB family nuclease